MVQREMEDHVKSLDRMPRLLTIEIGMLAYPDPGNKKKETEHVPCNKYKARRKNACKRKTICFQKLVSWSRRKYFKT